MNFNVTKEQIFDVLLSHPWNAGVGRKMLFLKNRYYVFDDNHLLIDGGVIYYNETLEKIFIRNEDIYGEVFIAINEDESVHLSGNVASLSAGKITIDTLLTLYDKELTAPLRRVQKIQKHLNSHEVYEMLMSEDEIDDAFVENFDTNLHYFSAKESQDIYIKLSHEYFHYFNVRILQSISFYLSSYALHTKLYEEMFMFLMGFQAFYEKGKITQESREFLVEALKERLENSYEWESQSISKNMINETLLYYKIGSIHLPLLKECVQKLFDMDEKVQREYAYYLLLMEGDLKAYEEDVLERLIHFYQVDFRLFYEGFLRGELLHVKQMNRLQNVSIPVILLDILSHMKPHLDKSYIFLIFLVINEDELLAQSAKKVLFTCRVQLNKMINTLPHDSLKMQLSNII